MLLATVSPSPSIALNGGITSVSLAAPKVVAALLYKSTFKNFIPLAAASKHRWSDSYVPNSLLDESIPLLVISVSLYLIAS